VLRHIAQLHVQKNNNPSTLGGVVGLLLCDHGIGLSSYINVIIKFIMKKLSLLVSESMRWGCSGEQQRQCC
jgi:hypothetical protein